MKNTNINLRNKLIYQIYVRNFSEEGTLNAVVLELDRIKRLGFNVIYLLPVHPIGNAGKKGSLGCPYSIQNYREIASELGSMDDFIDLISEVHKRGMLLMMDIVFNHTSIDSVLFKNHPEYFYTNQNGVVCNKVGFWSDVIDLDYRKDRQLWKELSDILVDYSKMGVDGYRCDVASLIPLDFWKLARRKVNKINKKIIWLSESVHGYFCKYLRDLGFDCASEAEIFQVFDLAYDYDVYPYFEGYIDHKRLLKDYLWEIKRQEEVYPKNYVKIKYLENHDTLRIAHRVNQDLNKIKNWTAFNFFQKGAVLIYAGEEYLSDITPSLFDKDVFNKNGDISEFIKKLAKLKSLTIFAKGIFHINVPDIDGVAYNVVEDKSKIYHGIFNVGQVEGKIKVDISDGKHRNYLTGKIVSVKDGYISLRKDPIIIKIMK